MPGQVHVGAVADLPRETRFLDKYARTGLVMDCATICFVWLQPDVFSEAMSADGLPPTHHHPFDQFIYMMEGEQLYIVGEAHYHLRPGDFIYVPRGVPHGGRVIGDKPVYQIEVFAPIRTDYLYIAEHQLSYKQAEVQGDGSRRDLRSVVT